MNALGYLRVVFAVDDIDDTLTRPARVAGFGAVRLFCIDVAKRDPIPTGHAAGGRPERNQTVALLFPPG